MNRPDQRNALNGDLLAALVDAMKQARDDDDVRAVVLTGAGDKVFCAGADLGGFAAETPLVEKHFAAWHQLPRYAQQLGCSEKSLVRASLEAAGVTPKAFISARIVLEAKRLLAHTTWPVARIAQSLGYSDLANFAKFFKREAGCTPTEFRSRQAANQQGMAERLQATG